MKKALSLILSLLFGGAQPVAAGFAIFQVSTSASVAVTCNIITGVATGTGAGTCASPTATCDGVADDSAAFTSFNTWATATWQASHTGLIELFIPSGKTCSLDNTVLCEVTANLKCPFSGIRSLLVSGTGSTLQGSFTLGGRGMCDVGIGESGGCSARIATVSAGSTTLTLLNSALNTRFTIGNYVMISGVDLQGFGYPTNPAIFEFAKVTNISGATITLDRALTNSYKSTWPLYNAGDNTGPDQGGPATVYAFFGTWDADIEISGLTISQSSSNQTYANVRSIVFRNVTVTGSVCLVPSQNYSWSEINVTGASCTTEVDKIVKNLTYSGGTYNTIQIQSSSVTYGTFTNVTITNALDGTPQFFSGSGNTFNAWTLGSTGYGTTTTVSCSACAIESISPGGVLDQGAPGNIGVNVAYSMSGGVITVPKSVGTMRWAVPGANLYWVGAYANETSFRVIDISESGSNLLVQTSLAGGFPTLPLTSGKLYINMHPAPQFTCAGCTGGAGLPLASWPSAIPWFSYSTHTFTGTSGTSSVQGVSVWGNLTSLSINVTNAYVGAGSLTFNVATFNNWPVIDSTGAKVDYGPRVDAKTAGNRVITLSSVTGGQATDCSGAGTGCLTAPDAVRSWFPQGAGSSFSADVSGVCPGVNCPSVTVTVTADQGVVIP